jgi:HEAT repeat protein
VTEIDQLLNRLSVADTDTAEAALARLAVLGPRAVEPLLTRYAGSGEPGRLRMLRLLDRIGDSRALDLLLSEARTGSPACRRLAVRALGSLNHRRAERVLVSSLGAERDSEVRAEIVSTLARLAAGDAVELLDPVLEVLFDSDEPTSVRRAAFTALAGLRAQDCRRLLTRLTDSPDDPLAQDARLILAGAKADSIPGLTGSLLPSSESPFPGSGLRLMRLGLRAVPSILRTLERHGRDPEISRRCVWTLGGMEPEARRALAARLSSDWPPEMLAGALEALSGVTDRRTLTALTKLAQRLGERTRREPDLEVAQALAAVRARAHRLIAAAGSRLAIADLKEALRETRPAPRDLLVSLAEVGRAEDLRDLLALYAQADGFTQDEIAKSVDCICRRAGKRRIRQVASRLPDHLAAALHHLGFASVGPAPRRSSQRPAREKRR